MTILKHFRLLWLFFLAGSLSGALPAGLYVGRFSGAISGDLIVALDGADIAYLAGYIETTDEAFFGLSPVGPDSTINISTDLGVATGAVSAIQVSGSAPGMTFSAERIRPEGIHQARAGLYAGSFNGTKFGNSFAAVLPDGRIWFLNQSITAVDIGYGTLGAAGEVSLTSNLGASLNGSFGSDGNALGNWSESGASGAWMVRQAIPLSDFLSLLPFTSEKIEDGWGWNDWLGWYTEVAYPWVYHLEHGWWWVSPSNTTSNAWVYDLILGWSYVRPDSYPWIYSSQRSEWLFYTETPGAERWFYSSTEDIWLELPQS